MNALIEIEITQPGRPTGQYKVVDQNRLKLESVSFPGETVPFDLAVIPRTLANDDEQVRVLLLGCVSYPVETLVDARLLGGFEISDLGLFVMAAVVEDRSMEAIFDITDLPEITYKQVLNHIKTAVNGQKDIRWIDKKEAEEFVKQALGQYRKAEMLVDKQRSMSPSWQPADRGGRVISHTEVEHYTEAEYTFFHLPFRFQHYIQSHLADDERILYAIWRPLIRSRQRRSLFGRKKLKEGILVLTTQRILHLVELMPPGSSGVRYGFNAQLGPVERLSGVSIEPLKLDTILLSTNWIAKQNTQTVEWEFPDIAKHSLFELRDILNHFIDDSKDSLTLRKATLPSIPDSPPWLTDPAANLPEELESINKRFTDLLPDLIDNGETFYAWALWPQWFEKKGYPNVLLVTDRRIRIIPDPITAETPSQEILFADIAFLEYVESILNSHIGLFIATKEDIQELKYSFPYSAEGAFRSCFEAIRRCVAITPLLV